MFSKQAYFIVYVLKLETYVRLVLPVLVASGAVARVEDDFLSSVVQTRLVSSHLPRLTQHPVLQYNINITHSSPMTKPLYFRQQLLLSLCLVFSVRQMLRKT